jgi:hypothetical protein
LRGLAVYGSAVSGDAIPGLSDLDLFVVLTDELTLADAIALQRVMPEPTGIAYLQPKFVSASAVKPYLIPGGYRVLAGEMPPGVEVDENGLCASSDGALRALPALVADDTRAWVGAIREKRLRHVRLLTTRLKPAVRATLVQAGEPPLSTWRAPWDALVRAWRDHDARRADELAEAIALLRATPINAQAAGEALLQLLTTLADGVDTSSS